MPEAKADAAQSDVREHGVGLEMVVMNRTDEERSRAGREDRDQLCADETSGSRDKRGRPHVDCHGPVWGA